MHFGYSQWWSADTDTGEGNEKAEIKEDENTESDFEADIGNDIGTDIGEFEGDESKIEEVEIEEVEGRSIVKREQKPQRRFGYQQFQPELRQQIRGRAV